MYGTIAKLRVKHGAEPLLDAWYGGMMHAVADKGWLQTTIYQSDDDPQIYWMVVLFEDREAYRRNAESRNQDARYRQLRSCLESDPEWHDGQVHWHSLNDGASVPKYVGRGS